MSSRLLIITVPDSYGKPFIQGSGYTEAFTNSDRDHNTHHYNIYIISDDISATTSH